MDYLKPYLDIGKHGDTTHQPTLNGFDLSHLSRKRIHRLRRGENFRLRVVDDLLTAHGFMLHDLELYAEERDLPIYIKP
jgi:hypothetical protein